jgi:hypothetical protein
MSNPTVIGTKVNASSGVYSGNAFHRGEATSGFADNYFDFGFRPEQVFIENVSGAGMLQVAFSHNESGVLTNPPATVSAEVDPLNSATYRRRNHRYVAVRSVGGPCTFRIEAW